MQDMDRLLAHAVSMRRYNNVEIASRLTAAFNVDASRLEMHYRK